MRRASEEGKRRKEGAEGRKRDRKGKRRIENFVRKILPHILFFLFKQVNPAVTLLLVT